MESYRKIEHSTTLFMPWSKTIDIKKSKISISEFDKKNGSPKKGDMIAIKPTNHRVRWLVSETYFKKNYIKVD